MTTQQLRKLLDKYLEGTASREEEALLLRYYEDCQDADWDVSVLGDPKDAEQAIWQRLQENIGRRRVVPLYRRPWLRAVAAVLVMAVALAYWRSNSVNSGVQQAKAVGLPAFRHFVAKQATLTLSDGSVRVLAEGMEGLVASDGGYAIQKKGRLLWYVPTGEPPVAGAPRYNLLALPAGSQYQVQLPDGSRVWLNATTAMRFPLYFAPSKRSVEIQGEAYFEVAKDPNRVFQVQCVDAGGATRGTLVEVLGTHFNVEAYGDEKEVRTTLLEGKVKVSFENEPGAAAVLAPGQQAVAAGNKHLSITSVDVESVVAWQRGLFDFKGADTRTVVQQLARWYGLQISYGRFDEGLRFSGKLSRGMALTDVLRILEQSGLRCTVKEQVIRVGT